MSKLTALVLMILFAGIGLRLYWITAPDDTLITIVPDDGFYYLRAAQHIADGDGSTFDGIYPTNGYHPLWMLTLIPLASVWQGIDLLRPVLLLSTIIVTLACLAFATLIYRRTANAALSVLIFAIVYLHPLTIAASLNAIETCTVIACFVAALWAYTARRDWLLGISLGLLCIARTDQVLIAVPLAAAYFNEPGFGVKRGYKVWLTLMWMVIAVALVNLALFGSPVQVSGSAVPYRISTMMALESNPLAAQLTTYSTLIKFILKQQGVTWLGVVFGALGLLAGAWRARRAYREHRDVFALAGGFMALMAVHVFLRLSVRDWYFNHLTLYLALVAALLLNTLWAKYRTWIVAGGVVVLLSYAVGIGFVVAYHWQVEMLDSAEWVRDNTPDDAIIGAWNAGIMGFYSERPTVNLDGVMNNAAFEAIKARQLTAFIQESGITHVSDYQDSFRLYEHFMGAPLDLDMLHEIDNPGVQWRDLGIVIGKLR